MLFLESGDLEPITGLIREEIELGTSLVFEILTADLLNVLVGCLVFPFSHNFPDSKLGTGLKLSHSLHLRVVDGYDQVLVALFGKIVSLLKQTLLPLPQAVDALTVLVNLLLPFLRIQIRFLDCSSTWHDFWIIY